MGILKRAWDWIDDRPHIEAGLLIMSLFVLAWLMRIGLTAYANSNLGPY
jgi:hypothetical protein